LLNFIKSIDPGTFVIGFTIISFMLTLWIAEKNGNADSDNDGDGPHLTDMATDSACAPDGGDGLYGDFGGGCGE
jgi:hypothetical protein